MVLRDGTLTITKAPLTISADDKSKPYGAALPVLTASYKGLVNGDTAASLVQAVNLSTLANREQPGGNVSNHHLRRGQPNYNLSLRSGDLLVTRATLTITADDKSKVYGAPLPVFTATYRGFVNGDTADSLTSPVVLSSIADSRSPAGVHQIRVYGGAIPNYTLVLNNGVLTVTKAPLIIRANNASKQLGARTPRLFRQLQRVRQWRHHRSVNRARDIRHPGQGEQSSRPLSHYRIRRPGIRLRYHLHRRHPRCDWSRTRGAALRLRPGRRGRLAQHYGIDVATGAQIRLEWSSDLQNWTPLDAQTAANGQVQFKFSGLDGVPLRFFRAVVVD